MNALHQTLASLSSTGDTWQLVAGLEAILIMILFVGWVSAGRRPSGRDDEDPEVPL